MIWARNMKLEITMRSSDRVVCFPSRSVEASTPLPEKLDKLHVNCSI